MDYVDNKGEKVPRIKVESKTVISNIRTNHIYKDEAEVEIEILKQNLLCLVI